MSVRRGGIVVILGMDGASVPGLVAAVAHERGLFHAWAAFPFETRADAVALMTGAAQGIADDELAAGVGFLTAVTVNAEVIGIVKAAAVPGVNRSVFPDLPGDGGGVLTEVPGDFTERPAFVEGLFDELAVIQGKVFVVAWN